MLNEQSNAIEKTSPRSLRWIAAAGALSLLLWAPPASAQLDPGSHVRIETQAGVVEGTLVDKVPDGYLVRVGQVTQIVPYTSVKTIAVIVPQGAPPVAPPAAPQAGPPVIVMMPAAPTYAPQAAFPSEPRYHRSPELIGLGGAMLGLGILGLVVGGIVTPVGAVMKSNNTCEDTSGTLHFQCEYGSGGSVLTAGIVTLIVSGLVTVGGGVMIGVGASRSFSSRALPSVAVSPRSAAFTWTF
jgi:hypothetical protein